MACPLLFDHALRARRRDRMAARFAKHDFLYCEAGDRLLDRLEDIQANHAFPRALNLGARTGCLTPLLQGRHGIEEAVQLELSCGLLRQAGGLAVVGLAEALPSPPATFDLVFSVMDLHWANDLSGALLQIRQALKPDGLFLACVAGGDTLCELRQCLMEAELELTGGAGPRVSPMLDARDAAALLQRAGFALPVADRETVTITYDTPLKLLDDLRGMGAANVLRDRPRRPLRRAVLMEALTRYQRQFLEPDGRVRATVELVFLTGWASTAT